MPVPAQILEALSLADPSWRPTLEAGLQALAAASPAYLPELVEQAYLPTEGRLFAAFAQPLERVRHVIEGLGYAPRAELLDGRSSFVLIEDGSGPSPSLFETLPGVAAVLPGSRPFHRVHRSTRPGGTRTTDRRDAATQTTGPRAIDTITADD